ncbi:hypothetical protein GCM10011352_07930 [Marinobacterium zhoushanense]|uniref:Uncharacterized protein n=1 Tax=Marinobacterium zhoushanense TaxID=1679163 RepID=A0ABQ1K4U7_9GAMM|nr:hypothetical protein GCM10011352_07930 [Marinobacterium zhoushanense]
MCADFALEAALGRDEPLASTSMQHRFEAGMDRQVIIESYPVLWEPCIALHGTWITDRSAPASHEF